MKNIISKNNIGSFNIFLLIIFAILIVLIILLNFWISNKVGDIKIESKSSNHSQPKSIKTSQKTQKRYKKIIRKSRLNPNRKYSESLFYADGEIIARYKQVGDKIFDISGEIPDGKIKFTDAYRNTFGTEYYANGKKHGIMKEYYKKGPLRREAEYVNGEILTNKEYFIDGILSKEENFEDAMWITDNDEVGKGKVYWRDGTLMYEWSLTNDDNGGFNKSYNAKGQVTEENYFDENGNLIKTIKR